MHLGAKTKNPRRFGVVIFCVLGHKWGRGCYMIRSLLCDTITLFSFHICKRNTGVFPGECQQQHYLVVTRLALHFTRRPAALTSFKVLCFLRMTRLRTALHLSLRKPKKPCRQAGVTAYLHVSAERLCVFCILACLCVSE